MMPSRQRKAVVLPAPLGPQSTTVSPFCTVKSSDFKARVLPKVFSRPRTWTTVSGLFPGGSDEFNDAEGLVAEPLGQAVLEWRCQTPSEGKSRVPEKKIQGQEMGCFPADMI